MTKAEQEAKQKAEQEAKQKVKVKLSCRYGKGMPGDIVSISADEAKKLKSLGVAK